MSCIDPRELVILKHGAVVPAAVLLLGWDLEDRGITFTLEPDGGLLVGPKHALTDADRFALRRWAGHLKMLLRHFAAHEHDAPLLHVANAPPIDREALL